jgi:hypothetical protein
VWAACGKDRGYTPSLILDLANRHARFQESDLQAEMLARPLDRRTLKTQRLAARECAEQLCNQLPEPQLGCLYLDAARNPVNLFLKRLLLRGNCHEQQQAANKPGYCGSGCLGHFHEPTGSCRGRRATVAIIMVRRLTVQGVSAQSRHV